MSDTDFGQGVVYLAAYVIIALAVNGIYQPILDPLYGALLGLLTILGFVGILGKMIKDLNL